MGIAGRFARHGAKPEALHGVEARRFQPSVVEGERLTLAVFEVQFAVVGPLQGAVHQSLDAPPIHARTVEKKVGSHVQSPVVLASNIVAFRALAGSRQALKTARENPCATRSQ